MFAARLEARGELCAADLQEMDRCIEEVLAQLGELAGARVSIRRSARSSPTSMQLQERLGR